MDTGGREFAAAFHREAVAPLLRRDLPGLRYAAGRLGSGSDVLGFDDPMSRDHDWGCRLTVLVDETDRAAVPVVRDLLARWLPQRFRGRPTRFRTTFDDTVAHKVEVATVTDFATSRLGVDVRGGLSTLDWLTVTGQGVLEVVAGPVYLDRTDDLAAVRRSLAWYPPDVERYLLACAWQRLAQRLPMIGRTAQTGQARQSRLLCAGLVGDLTGVAFLLHEAWAPYEKWREAAFARLAGAGALTAALDAAVTADDWTTREAGLVTGVEELLRRQRDRGLPTPQVGVAPFFDRPYRTVTTEVPDLLLAGLRDPMLRRLFPAGSVEQWVDNVDVLAHPDRRRALGVAYRAWLTGADGDGDADTGE